MHTIHKYFEYETKGNTDIINISNDVIHFIKQSDIKEGIAVVFAKGSTCAITTIEYESGLKLDLIDALERIVPKNIKYHHNDKWMDGNGHAHIRASHIGQSESIPIIDGVMVLGRWQQIIFIDFDNKSRHRKVTVQIVN